MPLRLEAVLTAGMRFFQVVRSIRSLDAWQTSPPPFFGSFTAIKAIAILNGISGVDESIHTVVTAARVVMPIRRAVIVIIVTAKAAHASPPTGTPSVALVVSRQGISSGKAPATFGTDMRSFAGVQFGMSL